MADKSFGAYSNLLELQLYLRCKLLQDSFVSNVGNDIDFAIEQQIGILELCVPILADRFGLEDFDLAGRNLSHDRIAVERNLPVPERCLRFLLSFYSCCLEAALIGVGSPEPGVDIIAIATATYRVASGIDLGSMCNRTLAFSALFLSGLSLISMNSPQSRFPTLLQYLRLNISQLSDTRCTHGTRYDDVTHASEDVDEQANIFL